MVSTNNPINRGFILIRRESIFPRFQSDAVDNQVKNAFSLTVFIELLRYALFGGDNILFSYNAKENIFEPAGREKFLRFNNFFIPRPIRIPVTVGSTRSSK